MIDRVLLGNVHYCYAVDDAHDRVDSLVHPDGERARAL
jgi:hypothetical protein